MIRMFKALTGFYSEGEIRSVRARKNIFATFLIRGGSILVGLMLVPITIHYVNPTRYGIWITLSSIIMLMEFFDIQQQEQAYDEGPCQSGRGSADLSHGWSTDSVLLSA